jgi:hypothetical protein
MNSSLQTSQCMFQELEKNKGATKKMIEVLILVESSGAT